MDEIATLTAAGEAGTFEGPTEASVLRTASEGGSFDEADSALDRMFLRLSNTHATFMRRMTHLMCFATSRS